nr:HupE/UreJ family protein [Paenibacillus hamazuiensis]
MSFYRKIAIVLATLWLFAAMGTAEAHFSSTGYSDITVGEKTLHYSLFLLDRELLEAEPDIDLDRDGKVSESDLSGSAEKLTRLVNDRLVVTGNGKLAAGKVTAASLAMKAKMSMAQIDVRYEFPDAVQRYMVQYNFYDGTNPDHRSFATIKLGEQTIVQVINSNNNIIQIEGKAAVGQAPESSPAPGAPQAQSNASWTTQLREFTYMGMKHIWSGPDHLLFLLGLLLAAGMVGKTGWTTLKLVTAFTVGHSITLILSALELASLSPVLVEPLIALSIIYIAAENIFRKSDDGNKRIGITFYSGSCTASDLRRFSTARWREISRCRCSPSTWGSRSARSPYCWLPSPPSGPCAS